MLGCMKVSAVRPDASVNTDVVQTRTIATNTNDAYVTALPADDTERALLVCRLMDTAAGRAPAFPAPKQSFLLSPSPPLPSPASSPASVLPHVEGEFMRNWATRARGGTAVGGTAVADGAVEGGTLATPRPALASLDGAGSPGSFRFGAAVGRGRSSRNVHGSNLLAVLGMWGGARGGTAPSAEPSNGRSPVAEHGTPVTTIEDAAEPSPPPPSTSSPTRVPSAHVLVSGLRLSDVLLGKGGARSEVSPPLPTPCVSPMQLPPLQAAGAEAGTPPPAASITQGAGAHYSAPSAGADYSKPSPLPSRSPSPTPILPPISTLLGVAGGGRRPSEQRTITGPGNSEEGGSVGTPRSMSSAVSGLAGGGMRLPALPSLPRTPGQGLVDEEEEEGGFPVQQARAGGVGGRASAPSSVWQLPALIEVPELPSRATTALASPAKSLTAPLPPPTSPGSASASFMVSGSSTSPVGDYYMGVGAAVSVPIVMTSAVVGSHGRGESPVHTGRSLSRETSPRSAGKGHVRPPLPGMLSIASPLADSPYSKPLTKHGKRSK